jgi:hypothetical protein
MDEPFADMLCFLMWSYKVTHLVAIALRANRDIQPVTMRIYDEKSHSIEPP